MNISHSLSSIEGDLGGTAAMTGHDTAARREEKLHFVLT